MKTIIIIGLLVGLIAGFYNDKAKENYGGELSLVEIIVPTFAIIFVIYAFMQNIGFGFMAILQILVGAYVGKKLLDVVKRKR